MIGPRTVLAIVYLAALALVVGGGAHQSPSPKVNEPATASIVANIQRAPDGVQYVVVRFAIEPQWHLYWTNPGDSGAAPTVSLSLPSGWTVGEVVFPRPQILGTAEDRQYGYERSLDLRIQVLPPIGALPVSIPVTAKVAWMVCKTICLLGKATLTAQLPTEPVVQSPPTNQRVYPSKLLPSIQASCQGTPQSATLVISAPAKSFLSLPVRFVPDAVAGVEFLDGSGPFLAVQSGEQMNLRIAFAVESKNAVDGPPRIRGLLLTGERETDPAYRIDLAPPGVPATAK